MTKQNQKKSSTSQKLGDLAKQLRGEIPGGDMGSRGLAKHLISPCERARTVVASGVKVDNAANYTHKVAIKQEPSRIAALVGTLFESELIWNDANKIQELYRNHNREDVRISDSMMVINCEPELVLDEYKNVEGVVGWSHQEFTDFTKKHQLTKSQVAANKVLAAYTKEKIVETISDKTTGIYGVDVCVMLLQPSFPIEINDVTHFVRPDIIFLQKETWRVAEIKVYLDRDGETSGQQVASTVQQAVVGTIALEQTLSEIEETTGRKAFPVRPEVDVVFRRHGGWKASITRLDAQAEITAFKDAIRDSGELLKKWVEELGALDTPEAIEQIPNHFTSACENNCAYFTVCRNQQEKKHKRILHNVPGVDTAEKMGIDTERARTLAIGGTPLTPQEEVAARWLKAGWEEKS